MSVQIVPLNIQSIKDTVQALSSQFSSQYSSIALRFVYVLNNKTYLGTKTVVKKESINSSAGLNVDYAFSILSETNQWGSVVPVGKARIILAGVTYKIISIETDPIGATYRLHLGSEYNRK